MSTPSIRINQTNSATRHTPITSPPNRVARDIFYSATRDSARRLFDGIGRSNFEADLLVQSGKALYTQKELEEALLNFTAAIADKDKCKANDLSHAEAYIGAGAVFDAQGKIESSLHHYHEGSRKLNALRPNSLLLAGSYVRIALLYEAKGGHNYTKAIEFLKKALEIYKLKEETKPYTAQVHHKLSLLNEKSGYQKTANYHKKQEEEIGSYSLELFLNGNDFLSVIFGMFIYPTKREQNASSVATELSPLKEAILPPLHVACSPIRVVYMDQKVGQSPLKMHNQSVDTHSIPRFRQDMQCSPMRGMHKDQGVGSSHLEMKDKSSSPLNLPNIYQKVSLSPARNKEQSVSSVETEPSPVKGLISSPLHDGSSPLKVRHKDQAVGSSQPIMQEMGSSPLNLPNIHQKVHSSSNTYQARSDVQSSSIRVVQPNLSSVIEKLKVYEAGFLERGKNKVAKSLLERCQNVANGEASASELIPYLDAHFEIEDNPIFAGRLTHRLKEIFQEARNALLKR